MKLLPFKENGLWGLMDVNGSCVIEPTFDYAGVSLDNIVIFRQTDGSMGILDTVFLQSRVMKGWSASTSEQWNGMIVVYRTKDWPNELYGYMDTNGEVIIPPKFSRAYNFNKYGATVSDQNDRLTKFRIDREGQQMGEKFTDIISFHRDASLTGAYRSDYRRVLINGMGEVIGNKTYAEVWQENEGKVPVKFSEDQVGWVNLNGETVECFRARETGWHFQDGLIPVENFESNWGLMNSKLQWIIDPEFDFVYPVGTNRFAIGHINENGDNILRLVDESGNYCGPHSFGSIGEFQDGFSSVRAVREPDNEYPYDLAPTNYIDLKGNLVKDRWSE